MSSHSIRLHGPWYLFESHEPDETTFRHATTEAPIVSMHRIRFDDTASNLATAIGDSASLLMIRPFRQPTGLTPNCSLRLNVQSPREISEVWLNGQRLTTSSVDTSIFLIDTALEVQNRLGVLLQGVSPDAPLLNSVSLMIEDEA